MTRTLAQCGTEAAYKRHTDHHQPIDKACSEAHRDYAAAWRAERAHQAAVRRARLAAMAGDELRVMCARMDAARWPVGRIAVIFGLSLEGAKGAVQEGRRILISQRRIGVS